MIRDDPHLDPTDIAACLAANYGLDVTTVTFLPLGFDLDAAVYDLLARGGDRYFLKLRTRRDSRAYPVTDPRPSRGPRPRRRRCPGCRRPASDPLIGAHVPPRPP
jgi:hypothetical protein